MRPTRHLPPAPPPLRPPVLVPAPAAPKPLPASSCTCPLALTPTVSQPLTHLQGVAHSHNCTAHAALANDATNAGVAASVVDCTVLRSVLVKGAEELLALTSGNERTQQHRWVAKGSKHGVNLYVLPQDSTSSDQLAATFVPAFLGIGVVRCPPVAVLELLSASERKVEYDEIFESALTVHRYDDVTAVERHTYWTPSRLIVAARDLCLLGHAAMLADGAVLLFAKSVRFDEGGGEVRAGWTRAQLDIGGFILQPLASATDRRSVTRLDAAGAYEQAVAALLAAPACLLTFVARCDLRGSLPAPLRNKLCERQPLMVHHIDRLLNKRQAQAHRANKQQLYEEKLRTLPVYPHLTATHTVDM